MGTEHPVNLRTCRCAEIHTVLKGCAIFEVLISDAAGLSILQLDHCSDHVQEDLMSMTCELALRDLNCKAREYGLGTALLHGKESQ